MANSTKYGLAATIWTENLKRAHRVAAAVDSGIIWINCWLVRDLRTPFGGMKQSGVGREGGFEALHFFTEAKNICVKL
jgi:aminomuconate-semialdehyde/2-hydroxymuconate-6-semialdehyde dehydrogenase